MKDEITLSVDGAGIIVGLGVHDGSLYEFAVSESSSLLHFGISRFSGGRVALDLFGVTELTVAELWEGPIVSEVFRWEVGAVPESCWEIPDSGWNALFAGKIPSLALRKEAALKIAHEKPDSSLVLVEFSYGGSVAAVCDRLAAYEATESR